MEEEKKYEPMSQFEKCLKRSDFFKENGAEEVLKMLYLSRNVNLDLELIFKHILEKYESNVVSIKKDSNDEGYTTAREEYSEKAKKDAKKVQEATMVNTQKLLEEIINTTDLQVKKKAEKALELIDLGYTNIQDILFRL